MELLVTLFGSVCALSRVCTWISLRSKYSESSQYLERNVCAKRFSLSAIAHGSIDGELGVG